MDLILDIGNFRVKGALFEEERVVDLFSIPPEMERLRDLLSRAPITNTLISSVNKSVEEDTQTLFSSLNIPFNLLDFSSLKVRLDVDEPEQVGHDRIANIYGALFHFPYNDCIVVDIGTAVTFDYIGSNGSYLGGAIYPGIDIGAQALHEYTSLLPKVEAVKPPSPVAKTTETHIQSGLYWGLLGAIERIAFEMRTLSKTPSDVKIIATGGAIKNPNLPDLSRELSDLVDLIDPALTLVGIHEIMKEKKQDV